MFGRTERQDDLRRLNDITILDNIKPWQMFVGVFLLNYLIFFEIIKCLLVYIVSSKMSYELINKKNC